MKFKLKRGEMLKLAAFSAVFALGGKKALQWIAGAGSSLKAEPYEPLPEGFVKKRWGMVIDMGKCADGCNKCIDACHTEHNVPTAFEGTKDEIKWIWTEKQNAIFGPTQHKYNSKKDQDKPFLYMCLQCDNPPCTRVCPVKATYPRDDGIVMMDFHRCIGCRFCMAACPYGCRSFNYRDPRTGIEEYNMDYPTRTMGVVEKCNFCNERVDKGQQPACVETCPEKVLTFGDLNDETSEIRQLLKEKKTIQPRPEIGTNPCVFYVV